MKGKVRPVSLGRKLVIDLMHASVPLVIVKRTLKLDRLVQGAHRAGGAPRLDPDHRQGLLHRRAR